MTSTFGGMDAPDGHWILGYCWPYSASPGEEVGLHLSSPTPRVTVEVARVGATRDVVWTGEVEVGDHALPADVDTAGCDWPVATTIPVDPTWRSGFYDVVLTAGAQGLVFTGAFELGGGLALVREWNRFFDGRDLWNLNLELSARWRPR